jgi:hypothetical protein
MEGRKRRKWDVAAPEGVPIPAAHTGGASARGGIGTPSAALLGAVGVITAQGPVPAQPAVNIHAAVPAQFRLGAAAAAPTALAGVRPGMPMDEETRARARQGAAAIVAKINQARAACARSRFAAPFAAAAPRVPQAPPACRASVAPGERGLWQRAARSCGERRVPGSAALATSAAVCPARRRLGDSQADALQPTQTRHACA